MTLNKAKREALRMMFGGRCAYCGCDLPEKGWHADHKESLNRESKLVRVDEPHRTYKFVQTGKCYSPERDHIGNLVPSCRACNIDKSSIPLESWRSILQERAAVCRRNYSAFRHAERFGLIVEVRGPLVFWFEKYNAEPDPDDDGRRAERAA